MASARSSLRTGRRGVAAGLGRGAADVEVEEVVRGLQDRLRRAGQLGGQQVLGRGTRPRELERGVELGRRRRGASSSASTSSGRMATVRSSGAAGAGSGQARPADPAEERRTPRRRRRRRRPSRSGRPPRGRLRRPLRRRGARSPRSSSKKSKLSLLGEAGARSGVEAGAAAAIGAAAGQPRSARGAGGRAAGGAAAKQLTDPLHQGLRLEGLGDVSGGARSAAARSSSKASKVPVSSSTGMWRSVGVGLDGLAHLVAALPGHDDVGQDHVRAALSRPRDGVVAVVDRDERRRPRWRS